MLTNLFGDLANDISIKNLLNKFGRFSFDPTSQLRVVLGGGSTSISSGTINTVASVTSVTSVTQANMSIGDIGKPATAMLQSAQGFYGSVGANFTRV